MFIAKLATSPDQYVMQVVLVMFSICVHELAHAYTALQQGDSTAADDGHLTLNPMVQMGGMSIVILLLIGISWGAVPVRPNRMRHPHSHALVAFAGPAANLILFGLFAVATAIAVQVLPRPYAMMFFQGASLNLVLCLFNLLPVPVLDGWSVFEYFFPTMRRVDEQTRNVTTFIVLGIAFMTPAFTILFIIGDRVTATLVERALSIV